MELRHQLDTVQPARTVLHKDALTLPACGLFAQRGQQPKYKVRCQRATMYSVKLRALAVLLITVVVNSAATCTSAADCSLNGDCVSGNCVCDIGWSGSPTCDQLLLLPSAPDSGYRNTSGASWGGRPVFDPADGLWHLFVAQMRNNCRLVRSFRGNKKHCFMS